MSREILILRHGMTNGNRLHRYVGRTDEPLCDEGREALRALSHAPAARVYVSPMLRCRETAQILFPAAALSIVDDLREMDFGIFENKSYLDLNGSAEYQAWLDSGCTAPIPEGECLADFRTRCCDAFRSILTADSSDRLVFVVHGGTIMSILSEYAVPRRSYYDWNPHNGRGYRLLLTQTSPQPALELLEEV